MKRTKGPWVRRSRRARARARKYRPTRSREWNRARLEQAIRVKRSLRVVRKAVGLTQGDVAARLHVSPSTIGRWEHEEGDGPAPGAALDRAVRWLEEASAA